MSEDTTVDQQQLAAEQAIADSDDAKRAAEKRAAALGLDKKSKRDAPADAKPKSKRQTTR